MKADIRAVLFSLALFACASALSQAPQQGQPAAKETAKAAKEAQPSGEPLKDDVVTPEAHADEIRADDMLRGTVKHEPPAKVRQAPFYEKFCKEDDPPVELNVSFDAAGINDIVPAFAQILKFNYLVDPQVKGAVTMSVNAKMTPREVWEMFEQILWLSGAYCSLDGAVVHVLPFAKMPQERKAMADHDPSANVEVDLLPVRSASSKDLVEKIKPFLTEGATAIDIPHQNSILIVEAPSNLLKIKTLIKTLDQKNKSNWPQSVIRCSNVSATRIKNELASLLPVLGFPVTVDNVVAEPGSIHLLSLDRLQAIVATAANQEALDELNHWVGILDRSDVGEQERMYVYKVVNSKADELAQALSAMFNVEGSSISPSASPSSGSSSSSGESSKADKSSADSASKSSSTKSSSTSTSLKGSGQGSSSEGPGSVFEIPVKVFADAIQNRLLIRTVPRAYAMVSAVLSRLDTVPSQVLLQVTVAEVTLGDSNQYGLEFSAKVTGGQSNSVDNLFSTNYSTLAPGSSTDYGARYYIYNPNDPEQKFGYLKAVAGKSKINVLSSPQIVVVNHSEAQINVGDKVPIVTSEITDTASTTATDTSLRRSIQYEDTGIILTITPHVTKGGLITLDLKQEVSDATQNSLTDIDSPVIQQRTVKTSMSIRDGSTLFVAGLIREREVERTSTIPFLEKMDFLAKMFGSTEGERSRTELVVMITGRVIDEKTSLEEMLKRYKKAMESFRRSEKPAPDDPKDADKKDSKESQDADKAAKKNDSWW